MPKKAKVATNNAAGRKSRHKRFVKGQPRRSEGRAQGYKVGYAKPPLHTRFKPGSSGNPRGRPRDVQDAETLLLKAALKKTTVNFQGKQHKLSRLQLACIQLANKSASGDIRSIIALFKLLGSPKAQLEMQDDVEVQRRVTAQKLSALSDEELKTLLKIMNKLHLLPTDPAGKDVEQEGSNDIWRTSIGKV